MTLFTMVILAYCVGLRLGEFVRLTLGDVDLNGECIEIRTTKFFKSRRLPVSASVISALRQYLDMRRRAGAAVEASAPLFWNERKRSGYAVITVQSLLVSVLRRAGVKTERGRVGPRIHDFRHTFVVDRMTSWYREGINPQSRLPYLATFLGHKNIYSTLVYLTVTPQLIQLASERFRSSAALLRNKGETT